MKTGSCKLCKKQKELKKSHTIPRAVFKNALNGSPYGKILDKAKGKVINTQDQWVSYMLCGDCEHILSSKYEKYSLEVLRGYSRSAKIQRKMDYLQIVGVDQKRIIIFAISILWRAIESDNKVFDYLKYLNVSDIIKDHFSLCIYGNELVKPHAFSVRISKLTTSISEFEDMELNFITTLSFGVVDNEFIKVLFVMEGYCFEIFLHTKPNIRMTGLGIMNKNKRILKMPYIEAFSIDQLRHSLQEMVNLASNQ